MRNVLEKIIRENQNAHFMFKNFFSENRQFYAIIGENVLEQTGHR
jgi:hypothetical protein